MSCEYLECTGGVLVAFPAKHGTDFAKIKLLGMIYLNSIHMEDRILGHNGEVGRDF